MINHDVLFTRVGHWLKVAQDLDDVAAASLVTNVRVGEEDLDGDAHDFQQNVLGTLEQTLDGSLSTIGAVMNQLAGAPIQRLIIETIHADTPLLVKSIDAALVVLLDQMDDSAESLDASVVTTSLTYGENSSSSGTGDNWGDGVLRCCTRRGDGLVNEHILAETIRCEVTATSSSGSATWQLTGEPIVQALSPSWPGGSGTSRSLASNTAASSNLVPNGDFEDEDATADYLPDQWIMSVGTLATHLGLTNIEQQTVTINGTPTGGHYTLAFTDRDARTYTTVPLAHNAASSSVQTALRALPWLASVTVSSTGTSPNLTHTVVFENVPSPGQLTSVSALTGGSPTITHATTVAGAPQVVRGARCLELIGNGSTLTCIQVPVTLTRQTCYGVNLWALVDVVPASGVLTVDLVDGIGGTVVADDQGTNNTFTIDLTGLTTSPTPHGGFFHTPLTPPPQLYLRVRLTTALSSGSSLFLDELCMVASTELYASGLFAAGFSGPHDHAVEDTAEITVANDRAGAIHEWLNRFLGLQSKRILFPTATPGTQPDSLIT